MNSSSLFIIHIYLIDVNVQLKLDITLTQIPIFNTLKHQILIQRYLKIRYAILPFLKFRYAIMDPHPLTGPSYYLQANPISMLESNLITILSHFQLMYVTSSPTAGKTNKMCTCKQPLAPENGCPNVPQWCRIILPTARVCGD